MSSKVTYRQQFTRCGKQRCRKCREGAGHGPYWYAYWSEKGHTVSKYIGAHLPEQIETERQAPGEEENPIGLNGTPSTTPPLRIYLLGQFRIERKVNNEWRAVDSRTWHRRRARSLLGCLLSNSGRRLGREQVMELLWPNLDRDLAANRLNGAVHELRQILEPDIARPAASRMLRLERDILELADSSQIWVDAEEFENQLKEADITTDPKQAEALLEAATALYRGSYLLEELYSEWASPRRDALQRAWVGLLLRLANLRVEQEAFASAIETLDRLRTADPTNETALQRLMILLTQLDRRGEALQVYRQHAAMLQRDYEGDPLPETAALYETLRKGQLPAQTISSTQTSLKREREAKIAEVAEPKLTPVEISFTRPLFQLGRHNQSPLIGRDQEWNTLQKIMLAIEDVPTTAQSSPNATRPLSNGGQETLPRNLPIASTSRTRHTHFLLLKGDAGIGKTRLAEELSLQAYTRGWTVVWSRSYEQEGTIPYRPWTELLRTLLPTPAAFTELIQMANSIEQAHPQQNSPLKIERLTALLPELASYSSLPQNRFSVPIPHEQERLHLWEATLGLLDVLSKIHPLLLVLDDLHWADDSSIELLTYLIHHLRTRRVLLVGTCRDGEVAPQHKLRSLIADLQREQAIAVVSVLPLTHSQIGTLVAHLPHNIVQSIQTKASGNPFFAEELARYIKATYGDDDLLSSTSLNERDEKRSTARTASKGAYKKFEADIIGPSRSLPEAIAAVLERRLSRLSTGCQLLLGKAAVLGGSFELGQLLPMATEHDEDTILDLLEEALHAGLLTEEGTGLAITYHFWHPLIISHLYGRLSAARRAQLHRRAAEAIKTTFTTQPEKAAAAIVHHLTRGGGDPMAVAYYAELTGNEAYSLTAYSEAQKYYLQAINALADNELYTAETTDVHTYIQRITSQTLAQFPLTDTLRVCRLLERVAECSIVLGNYEEARKLFEGILDLRRSERFQKQNYPSNSTDEAKQQREAQIQALLWREISNTWALIGEYARAYECNRHGTEVMSKAGITSGAAWACLHLQHGAILRFEGNYHEARRYLQEALEMLEQVIHLNEKEHSLSTSERSETINSTLAPSHKDLPTRTERALNGDPWDIGYAHERLGVVAASLGQMPDALTHLLVALKIYEQNEQVSEMARLCSNIGATYITKGDYKAAKQYLQRSIELAERAGDLPNMALVMVNLGDVALRTGDLLEAERWVKQSLTLGERINDREGVSWGNSILASVQEELGELRDAASSITSAIMIGRAIKSPRCIRFALIKLAELRITQAVTSPLFVDNLPYDFDLPASNDRRLLLRAKATLQKASVLEGIEIENILDGKYLLARTYFLLGEIDAALQTARQTLKEAQENEMLRTSEQIYHLLGLIMAKREDYVQAGTFFEQGIQICLERNFRLEHARLLHSYGLVLLQQGSALFAHPAGQKQRFLDTEISNSTQGKSYLYQARAIFSACQAALDLRLLEHNLAKIENTSALALDR